MKTIAIGDIHGRTSWKDMIKKESYDHLIFVGDYFDSYEDISAEDEISNFNEICQLKKDNPDKVTLLIGNHDFHYFNFTSDFCSRFRFSNAKEISEVVNKTLSEDLIQMSCVSQDYLFTHSGVTKTWSKAFGVDTSDINKVSEQINNLLKKNPVAFEFLGTNPYGDNKTQGPTWVRLMSLFADRIDFKQVVGHSRVKLLSTRNDVIMIDCLDQSNEYLVIEDGEAIGKEIYDTSN